MGGVDASGDEFAFSPAFSAAFGGTWRHPQGWTGTLDFSYEGGYFSNVPSSEAVKVDSYTLIDGRFGYDAGNWGAYVFAENLLDEDYVVSADRSNENPELWFGILGQPQTLGLILEAHF